VDQLSSTKRAPAKAQLMSTKVAPGGPIDEHKMSTSQCLFFLFFFQCGISVSLFFQGFRAKKPSLFHGPMAKKAAARPQQYQYCPVLKQGRARPGQYCQAPNLAQL